MKYKPYGPFEIHLHHGARKTRIDNEDIAAFWENVSKMEVRIHERGKRSRFEHTLANACGIYIFSVRKENKETIWYVGKAQKQSFEEECFTGHKLKHYHSVIRNQTASRFMMYLIARMSTPTVLSNPTEAESSGYPEMDFVERMFIDYGFKSNNKIRNKQETKIPGELVVEGFYNSKDRRRTPTKSLFESLGGEWLA